MTPDEIKQKIKNLNYQAREIDYRRPNYSQNDEAYELRKEARRLQSILDNQRSPETSIGE